MKKILITICLIGFLVFCLGNDGCNDRQQSESGVRQASPITVKKNSKGSTVEQQMIQDRIDVTTDPTKVMWIHLIALDGKIVKRMPVRNKVTSSGKRLEPTSAANAQDSYLNASDGYWKTNELIQPDGTYGQSDSYIFWFDPQGRYHQWGTAGGLGYLLTDYPIDLANPMDEITGMYNMNEAAYKWQIQQEEQLRKKEGI